MGVRKLSTWEVVGRICSTRRRISGIRLILHEGGILRWLINWLLAKRAMVGRLMTGSPLIHRVDGINGTSRTEECDKSGKRI